MIVVGKSVLLTLVWRSLFIDRAESATNFTAVVGDGTNMPKVTFEVNLPEEQQDFEMYAGALGLYCVISDLDSELRQVLKYEEKPAEESENTEETEA